jgi:ABC-type transport system involved in cytochrome bd biosynthesis fused ATPase/permease subunit
VSIILFGMLRDPLNVIPQILMAHSDAKISLNHIAAFLNTPVKEPVAPPQPLGYEEQVKVGFESTISTFEWSFDSSFKLTVPFIQFPVGQLSMISGPPQSGKSSLLAALMGDMVMTHGENTPVLPSRYLSLFSDLVRDPRNTWLYLHKVAYVSQTPWIEHGTVRENILFAESWDDSRYRAVLHQCDLLRDLSLFDNGDLTSTTNMSGKKTAFVINTFFLPYHRLDKAQDVIGTSSLFEV